MELPETRYAKSGDVNIAYQVTGGGPFDLVYVSGFVSNVELAWQMAPAADFFRALGSFCRLIRFDKRGTGMSDRVSGVPDLETRMDDVRAVMDAVGSDRAALMGVSEGGPMSILFAATYPHRAWGLVLWSTFPRGSWAPDYHFAPTEEVSNQQIEDAVRNWGNSKWVEEWVTAMMPSADAEAQRAWALAMRLSASPGAVAALYRMNDQIDVRGVLSAISVPTLVMVREGDDSENVEGSRYLAKYIPGARYVGLPGNDHPPFTGNQERVLDELERFLTESWEAAESLDLEPERVLATVLFTDIVGATTRAAELGDARWRELLHDHHRVVRRELARYRGREIDTAGDGFFASFDGPARGIRCAQAIVESVKSLGIEIRAGLHAGECELVDSKVAGIAVHIGARVAAEAGPGEVLVSSTLKDLVAGSGLEFDDCGVRPLKGIPGEWRLFAVASFA